MTDQRLRDLERDAAHGDLQAQARLLLERVRVGDLTEERLRLAAYLGHEAARLGSRDAGRYAEVSEPILGLVPWGQVVCVMASVAAVRGAMTLLGVHDGYVQSDLRRALHGEASRRDHWGMGPHSDNLVDLFRSCAVRVSHASVTTVVDWDQQLDYAVHEMLGSTFNELRGSSRWNGVLWNRVSTPLPTRRPPRKPHEVWRAAVRSHVPRELIPWALAPRRSST